MRVDTSNYDPADTGDDDDEKLKLAAWAELAGRNDGVNERAQQVDLPQMDIGKPAPTEANHWGALVPGNIDLANRPHVKNDDGSTSTVLSMGANIDGKEVLIPMVNDLGYVMNDEQAVNEYKRTGKHMGMYASQAGSDAAGEAIHLDQEAHPPADTLSGRGGPGYDMTPPEPSIADKPRAQMDTADFAAGPQPPAERITAPAAKFDDAPAPPPVSKLSADAPATAKLGEALSQPEHKEHYFFGDSNAASPWAILADLGLNRGRGVGGILALGGEEAAKAPEKQAELDLKKAQAEHLRNESKYGKPVDPTVIALREQALALQKQGLDDRKTAAEARNAANAEKGDPSGKRATALRAFYEAHDVDTKGMDGLGYDDLIKVRPDISKMFTIALAPQTNQIAAQKVGGETAARLDTEHNFAPTTTNDAAVKAAATAVAAQQATEPGKLEHEQNMNPILAERGTNGVGAGLSAEGIARANPGLNISDPALLQQALKTRTVNQKTLEDIKAANRAGEIIDRLHDTAAEYSALPVASKFGGKGAELRRQYDGHAEEYAGVIGKVSGNASQQTHAESLALVPNIHNPYALDGIKGLWSPLEANINGNLGAIGITAAKPRFMREQGAPPAAAQDASPPSAAGDSLPVVPGKPPAMPADATQGSTPKTERRVTKPDGKVVMYPLDDDEVAKLRAKGFKVD